MADEDMFEQTINEKTIYEGKIVHLKELQVRMPSGRLSKREVVYHPGAVAVLAEPTPGHLIFVEQFRKGPNEVLLEVPAGKLEPNEDPSDCARRELSEETGYEAKQIEKLYEFFTSPGFADEKLTLFYASELSAGDVHPDDDEFVHVLTLSKDEIKQRLNAGRIRDAKTLVAVLWWLNETSG